VTGDVLRVGDADGDLMVERRRALRKHWISFTNSEETDLATVFDTSGGRP
jgi:hypothetical protein